MSDPSWKDYSTTLRRLISVPSYRSEFQQGITGTNTTDTRLSEEMRVDLQNLIIELTPLQAAVTATTADGQDPFHQTSADAQEFFEESYTRLRRGALVTTVMSVMIFAMGLFLLGIAAAQAIVGGTAGTAIALAASGIVAIVAAFYRSPVMQMRESSADMQRSTMVLMSYMLGLSLLSKSLRGLQTTVESERLVTLTRDLVILLPGPSARDRRSYGVSDK